MDKRGIAYLERCGRGEISVTAPYNAQFVEDLKLTIHWTQRRWDKDSKKWYVDDSLRHIVEDLCREYYRRVRWIEEREQGFFKPPKLLPSPYSDMYLTENAPAFVVKAVYQALAKLFHPDCNSATSDEEMMKRINAAYDKIRNKGQ